MIQIKDLSNSPQWFVDLFLESISKLSERKERFKASKIFLTKDRGPKGEDLSGYGFLNGGDLVFMGRRFSPEKEESPIEQYKYITPFENGQNKET